jgi:hypothetical protein
MARIDAEPQMNLDCWVERCKRRFLQQFDRFFRRIEALPINLFERLKILFTMSA